MAQPFAGAIADKLGAVRVTIGCALLYAAGLPLFQTAQPNLMAQLSAAEDRGEAKAEATATDPLLPTTGRNGAPSIPTTAATPRLASGVPGKPAVGLLGQSELAPFVRWSETPLDDWIFAADYAIPLLENHFGVLSLEGFGLAGRTAAACAAGAILHYARQTQARGVSSQVSAGRASGAGAQPQQAKDRLAGDPRLAGDTGGQSGLRITPMESHRAFRSHNELAERGYTETDIEKILGGNILRVMEQVERVRGT